MFVYNKSKYSTEQEYIDTMEKLPKLLTVAYIDEMTASLQYMMAKHSARGAGYCDVVPEYEQHHKDECEHAEEILKRLEQMNVIISPDYSEIQSGGNKWTPIKTSNIKDQLAILIKAEEDAVTFYSKVVEEAIACKDFITETMFKRFIAVEKEHATDLKRIAESL